MIGKASHEAEDKVSEFLSKNGFVYLAWPQNQKEPDGDTNRAVLDPAYIKILKIEQVKTDAKNHLIPGSENLVKEF
jgi:hypothetical protein